MDLWFLSEDVLVHSRSLNRNGVSLALSRLGAEMVVHDPLNDFQELARAKNESTYTWVMENRMEFNRFGATIQGSAKTNVHFVEADSQ